MTADPFASGGRGGDAPPLPPGFTVTVYGSPAAQGHKIARSHGGRSWVHESNEERLRPWRAVVTAAAAEARPGVLDGPVAVRVVFTLRRPKNLPQRRRGPDGRLRPFRARPIRKPDLDTLARAIMDALSDAGAWVDDSQVIELHAAKLYVGDESALDSPGCLIEIRPVDEEERDEPR